MNQRYRRNKRIIIEKQLKKVYRSIDRLLNIRSGGVTNYDEFHNLMKPLEEFKEKYEKKERNND